MNEAENQILLKVTVSQAEAEKEVERMRARIKGLRAEQAALETQFNKGALTGKAYAAQVKKIDTELQALEASIKINTAVVVQYATAEMAAEVAHVKLQDSLRKSVSVYDSLGNAQQEAAEGAQELGEVVDQQNDALADTTGQAKKATDSIDALGKAINELEDQYNQLSAAERENAEVGGKLLRQINQLTAEQERNQKVVENSKKGVKEYLRDVNVLGVNVGDTVDSFKSGSQGVATFAKSIFTTRGALIALTAVPILLVLTGLVTFLTKSQRGMDLLSKATGAVTGVFNYFTKSLSSIGSTLANIWDNPKKAAKEFGEFVQQNLINRFKAFGVILEGIKSGDFGKIADGVIQLGTGVTDATGKIKKFGQELGDAAHQGIALANANKALEESEIKLNEQRGRSQREIERQKQLAEDVSKSIGARKKANSAALAEEQKLLKAEQSVQSQRVKIAEIEAKQGGNRREQQRKISEEKETYFALEADAVGRMTELKNQANEIDKEAAEKAKEAREKAATQIANQAEIDLEIAKRTGAGIVEAQQAILQKQIAAIEARAKAEQAAVEKGVGAETQRQLIQEQANTAIYDATKASMEETSKLLLDSKLRDIDAQLALVRQGSKEELDLTLQQIEAQRQAQESSAEASIKSTKELANEKKKINAQAEKATAEARYAFEQAETNRLSELGSQRIDTQVNLNSDSLTVARQAAEDRLDLEEQTQTALLEIERKYGKITDEQYQTRLAALQAATIAARKETATQLERDELAKQANLNRVRAAQAKEGSQEELDIRVEALRIQALEELKAAKGNQTLQLAIIEEFERAKTDLIRDFNLKRFEMTLAATQQGITVLSSLADGQSQREIDRIDAEEKAALSSAALSAEAREQLEAKFQKRKEEAERKAAERKRKLASAENIITTARNVAVAYTGAPPPFNLALAAIALAQGLAQQAIIDNQKFAQGGVYLSDGRGAYVTGPGTGTSDSINARISNHESVINANSTAKYYHALSAINVDGGGRPFPGIAASAPRVDMTGFTHFNRGGVMATLDSQIIAEAVRNGMKNVKIGVAVTDIRSVEADMNYVDAQSSI